jgi:hypothetical protein
MKSVACCVLLIISIAMQAHGQDKEFVDVDKHTGKCPKGYVLAGGMATPSTVYTRGCYTPEAKKNADEWFWREMCEGESGHGEIYFSGGYTWITGNNPKWVDHHCVGADKITYERCKDGKCVPLTKKQFERRL